MLAVPKGSMPRRSLPWQGAIAQGIWLVPKGSMSGQGPQHGVYLLRLKAGWTVTCCVRPQRLELHQRSITRQQGTAKVPSACHRRQLCATCNMAQLAKVSGLRLEHGHLA